MNANAKVSISLRGLLDWYFYLVLHLLSIVLRFFFEGPFSFWWSFQVNSFRSLILKGARNALYWLLQILASGWCMRMSAYAGQMERGFSAQALSSRGNSEMGSRYMVESGFYMSSFAATIFISGLVTVRVLLISLLVSLAVMLQSCESRNKGIVERQMTNIDYDYCKISTLNAELNGLLLSDLPSTCKRFSHYQASHHQYERDLNLSLLLVERYFGSIQPSDDGVDVILMDIDDILPPERFHHYDCRDCLKQENDSKNNIILSLYTKLRGGGWSMILLSRKEEKHRNSTVQNLISAGFQGWRSVIPRSGDELQMDVNQYFARRRAAIENKGLHISGIISSQMDALTGPFLGTRVFKLPNPMYYNLMDQTRYGRDRIDG